MVGTTIVVAVAITIGEEKYKAYHPIGVVVVVMDDEIVVMVGDTILAVAIAVVANARVMVVVKQAVVVAIDETIVGMIPMGGVENDLGDTSGFINNLYSIF